MPMAHRQLTMHRLLRGCSLRTVHCRLIKRTVPRAVLTDSEGCMRTYEELMEVDGMNSKAAESILDFFAGE